MNLLPLLPLWLAGSILIGLCLLGSRVGQYLHAFISKRRPEPEEKSHRVDMEGFIIGSVFGLFAFIVGFTFSIATDRFDARRLIVSEEANAIGTSFLRAELLDPRERIPLQLALRDYARTRIAPLGLSLDFDSPELMRTHSARDRIAPIAVKSVSPYKGTDLGVSVIESVNDVLNIGNRRELAGAAHIPDRVMDALLLYLIASSALLGFLTAEQPYRLRAASSLLFVLMSLAIVLILDLDRPRSGSILIPQTAMENLVKSLDRAAIVPISTGTTAAP